MNEWGDSRRIPVQPLCSIQTTPAIGQQTCARSRLRSHVTRRQHFVTGCGVDQDRPSTKPSDSPKGPKAVRQLFVFRVQSATMDHSRIIRRSLVWARDRVRPGMASCHPLPPAVARPSYHRPAG